jgi:hemolysin activation/secretion protein
VPATPAIPAPPGATAAAPAAAGPRFDIRRFQVDGATLVPAAQIDSVLAPFVGQERDFGDVQKALEALERLFVERGYGSVQVLLPEQELEQGSVRFNVVEPKLAKVSVEGNKVFSEANVRASLPALKEGAPPNSNAIAANLRLANENPAKATTVLLRAGAQDGEIDAVVRLVEDKTVRWNMVVDNTGSGNTGAYRVGAGVQVTNLRGTDHVFAAQAITAPEERNKFQGYSRDVAILGVQYRIPLYTLGDSLDFTAGYSNVNSGVVQNIFSVSGKGRVYGVRYTANLAQAGALEHRLILAWDWRIYENNVTPAGGGAQIVPDITVRPVSLTYAGTLREQSAETSFYLSYNRNLPGGSFGGSREFDFSRGSSGTGLIPSARPGYTLLRFGVSHQRAFAGDWQARVAVNGQHTTDMLIAGEQFGIGGANSVRGFNERQFANDRGYVANLEIYTPDLAARLNLGENMRLRLLAFRDHGYVQRNQPLPGDTSRVTANGTGVGLRLAVGNALTFRLDGAFADAPANTGNTLLPTQLKQFRMHGAMVYLF